MPFESAQGLYLERQITLARAIFVALALVALIETGGTPSRRGPIIFLISYLLVSLGLILAGRYVSESRIQIPLAADFLVLAVFLYLTPSVSAFWFLFLFVVFSLAARGNKHTVLVLVFAATVGIIARVALEDSFGVQNVLHWIVIGFGTMVSGLGMGFLGARETEYLSRQQFLEKLTGRLQFDRGLTESVRQVLGELALAFECEQACLAVRDDEVERLFVWKVRPSDRDQRGPETMPLSRCDTFLTDSFEVSMCWEFANSRPLTAHSAGNERSAHPAPSSAHSASPLGGRAVLSQYSVDAEESGGVAVATAVATPARARAESTASASRSNAPGDGWGWDRRTGEPFRTVPAPPSSTRDEFGARSLLAVTIEATGRPTGRVLLVNPSRPFSGSDLRWFEQIVRHLGPPLENIFLLRNLRSRAVESERSRISRDLHDGILQTLLSLNIQLDVLRRKLPQTPEQAATELGNLQRTVVQESDELRRMVTDLRPLHVESADMRELMLGFAERFRNESGLGLDLFIEDRNLRLPDRICRDLFQIYRESLHNIKKHANASHVVVKLGQDEAKVFLVVDDNGRGFSFSGRFTSEELDRLRLGPISIKERTRSVGGTLTVESNPGHGARLTIEIPLN
jgi:signal transduction histidine kinase